MPREYYREDGGELTSSHVRFFAVVRITEAALDLVQVRSPDEHVVTYDVSAVQRWYLSAAACDDGSKLGFSEMLRRSAESLLPPGCRLTCR